MFKPLAALAIAALALAGCSAPKSGMVLDRDHDAAWSQWHSGSTHCDSKGQNCTTSPGYMQHYPESWELKLRNGSDEGWRDVGEDAYNRCVIGDHYPECAQ